MHHLIVIPVLEAIVNDRQQLFLTRKFIDGVIEYKKYWDGQITVLIRVTNTSSSNLDNFPIDRDGLPFEIRIIDCNISTIDIQNASIVLAGMSYKNVGISKLCKTINIPCVYNTEYTLKTQLQIIKVSRANPVVKIRRVIWAYQQSLKQKNAIKIASGVQCNGTPTYNNYKKINKNALLFFDNRVKDKQLIPESIFNERLEQLKEDRPVRLAFSGRLIMMKGADHLIKVATELKVREIPFIFSIYGSGSLEAQMKQSIAQLGLEDVVFMCGVLDFELELLPNIQKNVDLFISCHRQGDPSCTYIETLACGVPIVGYSNEAFDGILHLADVGYSVQMDDFHKLSDIIIELSNNRELLRELSYNAIKFAKDNLFDSNFKKRITHLEGLCVQ